MCAPSEYQLVREHSELGEITTFRCASQHGAKDDAKKACDTTASPGEACLMHAPCLFRLYAADLKLGEANAVCPAATHALRGNAHTIRCANATCNEGDIDACCEVLHTSGTSLTFMTANPPHVAMPFAHICQPNLLEIEMYVREE